MVDAREKQAIAILDIANAFLHLDNAENIIMLLCGKLSEMMVQVYPTVYRNYVTYFPNVQAIMYVILSRALYAMIRAALLFYRILRSDLENMGFEINPYDPCVANKMMNGH